MNYSPSSNAYKELTQSLLFEIEKSDNSRKFYLAISGGSSPIHLFKYWVAFYRTIIPWHRIELFWVDERSVPPDNDDSNYKMAKNNLLDFVNIPNNQIHRIKGENETSVESETYSEVVLSTLPTIVSNEVFVPVFDYIILGIGDDGHTSSIFPGDKDLLLNKRPYYPSQNPYNGQYRVSMTGYTIMNATYCAYLVVGNDKNEILSKINEKGAEDLYPAAYLIKNGGQSRIFHFI